MAKKHSNTLTLGIISFIAIVNALGYGIIIPIMYTYVAKFGINALWVGILFATFSLAQFISTPIIGRLSDRFGRKPMLAYSVLGTAVSFLLMAVAKSASVVFIARIMDGISGGNISVAQAVISDITDRKERAKWFGILGASFGFGFVFGPAIGGFLSTISLQAPFYFAAALSMVAVLMTVFLLQESLQKSQAVHKPITKMFDLTHLFKALFEPYIGLLLIASFIASVSFSIFILGMQVFMNDTLKLSPTHIAVIFVIFGVIGLIMQGFALGKLVKIFKEVPLLILGVVMTTLAFLGMGFSNTYFMFIGFSILLGVGNSFLSPLITAILSKHTRREDQGGMMGINQSYVSLANVAGPIIGGALASISVHYAFFGASAVLVLMFFITLVIARESGKHVIAL